MPSPCFLLYQDSYPQTRICRARLSSILLPGKIEHQNRKKYDYDWFKTSSLTNTNTTIHALNHGIVTEKLLTKQSIILLLVKIHKSTLTKYLWKWALQCHYLLTALMRLKAKSIEENILMRTRNTSRLSMAGYLPLKSVPSD